MAGTTEEDQVIEFDVQQAWSRMIGRVPDVDVEAFVAELLSATKAAGELSGRVRWPQRDLEFVVGASPPVVVEHSHAVGLFRMCLARLAVVFGAGKPGAEVTLYGGAAIRVFDSTALHLDLENTPSSCRFLLTRVQRG